MSRFPTSLLHSYHSSTLYRLVIIHMESKAPTLDHFSTSSKTDAAALVSFCSRLVKRGHAYPPVLVRWVKDLIYTKKHSFGDEKYEWLEHLGRSAMLVSDTQTVVSVLSELNSAFPNSQRVHKLEILYEESKCSEGGWANAEGSYKKLMEATPEDVYPRKRMIACLKAQGRVSDAIGAIKDQLEVFSSDVELWHEMGLLYLSQCAFSAAIFPLEEMLLSDPFSFYNLLIYAETLASSNDWALAQKYYCKALQYRPDELRALWGLLTCLAAKPNDKMRAQLLSGCKTRMINIYQPLRTHTSKICLQVIQDIS